MFSLMIDKLFKNVKYIVLTIDIGGNDFSKGGGLYRN